MPAFRIPCRKYGYSVDTDYLFGEIVRSGAASYAIAMTADGVILECRTP